jgi:hypothetical protein
VARRLRGVRKVLKDRQLALNELVKAIRKFRTFTGQPLTLATATPIARSSWSAPIRSTRIPILDVLKQAVAPLSELAPQCNFVT